MASSSFPAASDDPPLGPPKGNRFGSDWIIFGIGEGFPRQEAKATAIAPGAWLQFKTVEDQAACKIWVATGSRGTPVIFIDPSKCEHNSQLYCEIPKTSALLMDAANGSRFNVSYHLVGSLAESALPDDIPLRGLSLVECGARPRHHIIRKKVRLNHSLRKHKFLHDITLDEFNLTNSGLALRVASKSSAFCLSTMSTTVREISTPSFAVHQIGKRIQGRHPKTSTPNLLLSHSDSDIAIDPTGRTRMLRARPSPDVPFDFPQAELRRLLPPEDTFDHAFMSLWVDDTLVAACECNLSSRREAMSSAELSAAATNNYEILRAASDELRNSRYWAAVRMLDRIQEPSTSDFQTSVEFKMRALLHSRRFNDAIRVYHSLGSKLNDDALIYSRYIEALANSGQYDRLQVELETTFSDQSSFSTETAAKLYRYSSLLPEGCSEKFADRLLAATSDLRSQMPTLLHVGHDLAERRDRQRLSNIVAALNGFQLSDRESARVALLEAQRAFRAGKCEELARRLNEALHRLNVEPVSIVDPSKAFALNNLDGPATAPHFNGPLVTVIMTAFNSEATIDYSIRSVLAQSHANLELLVVDDCSVDRTREIIADFARQDARVRAIFANRNAGTYAGKNLALHQAKGEYITCQDSDDWAHPHRIEKCVWELHARPDLVAVGTQVIRFSSTGGLQFRRDYIQPDAPSLMYRSEPIRLSLGYYDTVRAAADTEFERRMKLTFGKETMHYLEEVLTLAAWSENSLTGGGPFAIDNRSGVMSPVRNAYRREFVRWHEVADSLYVDFPQISRPFPAPAAMVPLLD